MSFLGRLKSLGPATCLALVASVATVAGPDGPIITEVYTDPEPAGSTGDGPVGRDRGNLHQEFIEIYLPAAADLRSSLQPFKNALNLTFYEIEGDHGSSGYTLVNYRIDLPTFDLDPINGLTSGAVERPPSGVVVLGWVDYVGDPPTDLAGTPGTRVARINGGITTATNYVFVAMNGQQFSGTTNLRLPDPSNPDPDDALSLINMPPADPGGNEYASGILTNGSNAYLLVNRDDPGYVKLYDRDHQTPSDPSLADGSILQVSSFLDGVAGNDDGDFNVILQPYPEDVANVDLAAVLPDGGPYSLLYCPSSRERRQRLRPSIRRCRQDHRGRRFEQR